MKNEILVERNIVLKDTLDAGLFDNCIRIVMHSAFHHINSTMTQVNKFLSVEM